MALLQTNIYSKSLQRDISINCIIPIDRDRGPSPFKAPEKPFKTLYLMTGFWGNHNDWLIGANILMQSAKNNLAIILVGGENRFYVDNEETGELYGKFVGEEIVQLTRALFPLSHDRNDTIIGGFSMGGYGALRNGLKYNDTFGKIIALSHPIINKEFCEMALSMSNGDNFPLFSNKKFMENCLGDINKLEGSDKDILALLLKAKESKYGIPDIYSACGTEDSLISVARSYRDFAISNGANVTYEEGPGGHDLAFWEEYIKHACKNFI